MSTYTPAQREERAQASIERLKQAKEALESSDGWLRWLKTRSKIHRYSFHNQLLIAIQCHSLGIEPTILRGYGQWRNDFNRQVRKGETGIRILRPNPKKLKNEAGEEERKLFFKEATVFDLSQTDHIDGAEEIPTAPPIAQIEGDEFQWALEGLAEHADLHGWTTEYAELERDMGGYFNSDSGRIVINNGNAPNHQVKTLIHELAHAHGILYDEGRGRAEVIVEAVAFVVCDGIGLDTGAYSFAYIANWAIGAESDTLVDEAQAIDTIARKIESALKRPDPVPS